MQLKLFYLNISYGGVVQDYYVKTPDGVQFGLNGVAKCILYNPYPLKGRFTAFSLSDLTLEKLVRE